MPVYIVEQEGQKPRVVESRTPGGARQHVARALTVRKISTRESFDLSAQGLELETAGEEAANDEPTLWSRRFGLATSRRLIGDEPPLVKPPSQV